MEGPRAPVDQEYDRLLNFLDSALRPQVQWSLKEEYPTALTGKNLHNSRVITQNGEVLAHALIRPLIMKTPTAVLKIAGIGSVVTDPAHRQMGLSSKIISSCLDEAKAQDCDLAILWTDQYDFYRRFGFELCGFEPSYFIEKQIPTDKVASTPGRYLVGKHLAPEAILRLYLKHPIASVRTVEEIRSFLNIPQAQIYSSWNAEGQLIAYAVEGKGLDLPGYIHEWGGETEDLIQLFNYILKVRGSPFTVLTPYHAFALRKKLKATATFEHLGYLGMMKVLRPELWIEKINKALSLSPVKDCKMSYANEKYTLTHLNATYQFDEKQILSLVYGPESLDLISDEKTREALTSIFPMPMWFWGWDSV